MLDQTIGQLLQIMLGDLGARCTELVPHKAICATPSPRYRIEALGIMNFAMNDVLRNNFA